MPAQNLPAPYAAYVREQRRMARGAVAEVRRQWRRTGDDFDASWESVGTAILTTTGATQHQVAELAGEFIPDYMDQAFTRPPPAPVGRVNPNSLVGVAGDGRTAEGLMYGAVTRTKSAVGSGLTPQQARAAGLAWITMATTTLLADTIRAGEVVGGATRVVGSRSSGRSNPGHAPGARSSPAAPTHHGKHSSATPAACALTCQ
ncbi:hypothetical protein [Sanguibacter sp. Z1732]|uniref:hypothetical protein n=1 Tax=Sanguibacter sp. Z1732 TaxID=3435412 RepID=UPI003D9CBE55